METKSGIYFIRNVINGHEYIGSSKLLIKRCRRHFAQLRMNCHKNAHLQNAFNKYGESNFIYGVVEYVVDEGELLNREQYYVDVQQPFYNINKIVNSSLGVKRRPETIEKIRQANSGLKHPEWRNQIKSVSQGGDNHWTKRKNFSIASKEKMSQTHKELYRNGYINPKKGKKIDKEIVRKTIDAISKPIIQYDLIGIVVQEWKSAKEASLYGFNANCICRCCKHKNKTHKNYIWEYKINTGSL